VSVGPSVIFSGVPAPSGKEMRFVGLPPQTPLSEHVLNREQALQLFTQLEEEGHVHTGFMVLYLRRIRPQFVVL